jgi:O-antigen ligase
VISPTVAIAYAEVNQSTGYLSLDVYATFETLMLSLYYFIIFILGIVLINSRKRIKYVLILFIVLGVVESIYGMYLVSIGQTGTLVQITTVSILNASGTFINKNHLVAFLSLCFILGLTFRMILTKDDIHESYLGLKIRVIRYISRPIRLLDFSLFLILAGIWNTHSRAGILSFFIALIFFFVLIVILKNNKKVNYKVLMTLFFSGIILFIIVADDINYILETLGAKSDDSMQFVLNSAQGRLLAFKQVIDNYSQYWLTGVGPGAYQVFFVNHRVLEQTAFFDHAHNDYIEFAIEYGLFSLVILLILIIFMYRIIKYLLNTNKLFYKFLGIGIVSCVIYMLLHGNMDFNARIPANIVTIIVAISVIYGKIVMSGINITTK